MQLKQWNAFHTTKKKRRMEIDKHVTIELINISFSPLLSLSRRCLRILVEILQNPTRKSTIRTMAIGCSTNRWEFICCSQKMRYPIKKPSKVNNKSLHKRKRTNTQKEQQFCFQLAIDLYVRKADFLSIVCINWRQTYKSQYQIETHS